MLPVAEIEIKEQKHLKNRSPKDEEVVASEAASLSSDSTLASGDHASGNKGPPQASVSNSIPTVSVEEAKVLHEFLTIAGFKNNLGIPNGNLKSLDGDALEQLESSLSIDDQ